MSRKRTRLMVLAMLASTTATMAAFLSDVLLKGLDANKPVVLVVNGTERPLGTVGAGGNMSIPLDPSLDAALDPNKNYVVMKREACNRYEIVEEREAKQRCRDEQGGESGKSCGPCGPVGLIIQGQFKPGADPGQMSRADMSERPGSGGFSIGGFGFVSGSRTDVINAEETALPTIDQRFISSGYNAGWTNVTEEKGTGVGWGGGVNLAFGQVPVGIRLGLTREQERSAPRQTVRGERTLNGLVFEQSGDSQLGSTTLFVGPTVHIPGGIVVTGGPAVNFWQTELSQTGSLRALCPNPCMVVRTDDVRQKVEGTDVGFHFGAEYYPGDSWYGFYTSFLRVTLKDVYDPTAALALPRDWKDVNFFIGASIRTNGGRPRAIGR